MGKSSVAHIVPVQSQSAAERLRSLVVAEAAKPKPPGCIVCNLDPDLRAAVEALRSGGHPLTSISRHLKDPAIKVIVSPQTIGQHFILRHHDAS